MEYFDQTFQFGGYSVRIHERETHDEGLEFCVTAKKSDGVEKFRGLASLEAAMNKVREVAASRGDVFSPPPGMLPETPKPQAAGKCPYGMVVGKLVLCDRSADETGARAEWKARDCGRLIVTPYWCRERCKRHGGPGHL